ERTLAERESAELRASVGTIELKELPAGATVSIDGNDRSKAAASGPLRLSAGPHVLRVTQEGSLPFEMRFDLAGRQALAIPVRLATLTQAGRLRVTEQRGRSMEVLVD